MTAVRITSSAFNRDSGHAKREARSGPVIITNRGAPEHVLLSWEVYRRLVGHRDKTILEALALPGVEAVDFDPPRLDDLPQPARLD